MLSPSSPSPTKLLLDYFGFSSVQQDNCCCICDGKYKTNVEDLPYVTNKVRFLADNNHVILEGLIKTAISDQESQAASDCPMSFDIPVDNNLTEKIMEGVEYVETEKDLLRNFGIWNEACSSKIFSLICEHTSMLGSEMNSDGD